MKNPTTRIGVILIVIFLIPALFFSVYEMSSLSRDEKIIEDIYQKQLEAILFSVNQYSDDILTSWMTKTELALDGESLDNEMPKVLRSLLELNGAIDALFVADLVNAKSNLKLYSLSENSTDSLHDYILDHLEKDNDKIEQLLKYKKSGFAKSEVLGGDRSSNFLMLIYILGEDREEFRVSGFIIDPEIFIEDLVGPRLQSVSKDQFTLSVYDKSSGNSVYSTNFGDTTTMASVNLTKDFWIFPNYAFGIQTQGPSLEQLVYKRTTDNLILLLGLDVVLIVALIMVYRNVKREVQLAQNKSDFVANVSHEIRTPLALISMFAETLEMGRIKTEEKRQEYYRIISKETQRLTGIVNKILNFSQTEAGKKVLDLERVDLSNEIKELLKTYDFHLTNKGFEYYFANTDPLWVRADREALAEMIINLIDNAIKYSIEKKRIEITIGKTNGQGWVAVKDFGEGISALDQKHIFDKFYRVSSGNLAKSRGTGLGLSFVKQMIEQQNGTISVTSELGSGSTFILNLPLAE